MPGIGGHRRPAADIDEDLLRGQPLAADLDLVRGNEARVAAMHGAVLGRAQGCFGRRTPRRDDLILALLHPPHVHRDAAADHHTELGGAACHVRGVGAGDQCLGGRAAGVDACPAECPAFDDCDVPSGACETLGEGWTGLAAADDDGVIRLH